MGSERHPAGARIVRGTATVRRDDGTAGGRVVQRCPEGWYGIRARGGDSAEDRRAVRQAALGFGGFEVPLCGLRCTCAVGCTAVGDELNRGELVCDAYYSLRPRHPPLAEACARSRSCAVLRGHHPTLALATSAGYARVSSQSRVCADGPPRAALDWAPCPDAAGRGSALRTLARQQRRIDHCLGRYPACTMAGADRRGACRQAAGAPTVVLRLPAMVMKRVKAWCCSPRSR
jgi:hypothetical protein